MKHFANIFTLLAVFPATGSAGLMDAFDELQPVNSWVTEFSLSQDSCSDSVCGDCTSGCSSTCDNSCYPRIPMMMGDGGLGVPTTLFFQFQNHLTKVSENNSVIPQDRIGISWNLLNDVETRSGLGGIIPGDDQDLSEFKLRYEKTFFDGNVSVDVIMPFNITNERDQRFATLNDLALDRESELGDLAINLKALLHRDERFALSVGMMVELPTSDPQQILVPIGPGFGLRFDNHDIYYVTPWIGGAYTPNDKMFVQSFMSYRMNTDRHPVQFLIGPAAIEIGNAEDPDYFMWNTQLGYRLYENAQSSGVTAVIPTLELHYTGSTDTDPVDSAIGQFGLPAGIGQVDYLTLTLATNVELGRKASFGAGFGLPLRESNSTFPLLVSGPTDRGFDWSFNMNFNYYFD